MEQTPTLESRLEIQVRQAQLHKNKNKNRIQLAIVSLSLGSAIFVACAFVAPRMMTCEAYVLPHQQAIDNWHPSKLVATVPKPKPIVQTGPSTIHQQQSAKQIQHKSNPVNTIKKQKWTNHSRKRSNIAGKKAFPPIKSVPATISAWEETTMYQKGDRVVYRGKYYEATMENKNYPPHKRFLVFQGAWQEVEE